MPRVTYRYDRERGCMVGPDGMPMLHQGERAAEPQAPMYVNDNLPGEALQSQVDGQMFTSKSALRASYRRHGVEEVGTDTAANRNRRDWIDEKKKREKRRKEIRGALYRAHSRMGYGAP